MTTSIAVLGDGAMGTACALVLAKKPQNRVTLWSAREENGRRLQAKRENVNLLPGIVIPETIQLTLDIEQALDQAALVVVAIPTVYLRTTLVKVTPFLQSNACPIVSTVKGLEVDTFLRPTEVMLELLGPRSISVMSGPGHAEEMARGKPTSLVVASRDAELAQRVQIVFSNERFRLYTNKDVVGIELAAALKNVIALAAGISDGLGFGDNAKSALMTRALVEMIRFGLAHQAEQATFFGLAGIGDLITTCVSPHGRNRWVGEQIGRGLSLQAILNQMVKVAEGVNTARSVYQRAQRLQLEMPISTEVYRVLYEGKSPLQAVEDLMMRDLKSESIG